MIKNKKSSTTKYIYLLFLLYFCLNLSFLTTFPFIHSDEPWLSGLSRNILESGDYSATESFFDLKIRNPHAIKAIFHTIQIIFIKVLGYSIFSVRLISLVFSILTLHYIYKLSSYIFESQKNALISTLLLMADIQFIYASHFARQEIILLFSLVLGLYLLISSIEKHSYKNSLVLGALIGLSIGIHPNSFIISLPFGMIYLYHILKTKKLTWTSLSIYILTVGAFACSFILLSKVLDPNFISNYTTYGQNEFGVLDPLSSKFTEVKYFYLKLFHQVSGTYYMPNIKFQMIIFVFTFIIAAATLLSEKCHRRKESLISIILSIIAINFGIILLGRYNQTSIIFIFPLFYILITYLTTFFHGKEQFIVAVIILIILILSSAFNILPYINHTYDDYIHQISQAVPKDAKVLANLNAEFYFNNHKLLDYRNLAFLKDNNMSFSDYIIQNNIEYIIISEEMDLIYNTRPKWYGVYGNLNYYEEMQNFLAQHCKEVYTFTDRVYGIRISQYINSKDWQVKIYKVRL